MPSGPPAGAVRSDGQLAVDDRTQDGHSGHRSQLTGWCWLVEAAMPECSAGTLVRADEVTGIDDESRNRCRLRARRPPHRRHPGVRGDQGIGEEDAERLPVTHPTIIGIRGPRARHQWPVNTEASNHTDGSWGMKSRARLRVRKWLPPTTSR